MMIMLEWEVIIEIQTNFSVWYYIVWKDTLEVKVYSAILFTFSC